MSNLIDISIVVPVYGCDGTIVPLYERVAAAVAKIPASFELIFVDDGGPGHPWQLIKGLSRRDSRVKGLRLLRNFGQHHAIMAGIDIARGKWLVIMDCDLQDRPEEIPRLWAKAQEGFEVVFGRREKRQDSFFKRLFSQAYHRLFAYMTDQEADPALSSFGIYSRNVVDIVKALPEQPRVFPLLVRWFGFKTAAIDIAHDKRFGGESSYDFSRKFSLAIETIASHSGKPLKIFIQIGFLMAVTSFCYGLWLVIRYYAFGNFALGWTSVMVSMFFLSGILLFVMGVVGTYIGQIFNQVKGRPAYVLKEYTQNASEDSSLNENK